MLAATGAFSSRVSPILNPADAHDACSRRMSQDAGYRGARQRPLASHFHAACQPQSESSETTEVLQPPMHFGLWGFHRNRLSAGPFWQPTSPLRRTWPMWVYVCKLQPLNQRICAGISPERTASQGTSKSSCLSLMPMHPSLKCSLLKNLTFSTREDLHSATIPVSWACQG